MEIAISAISVMLVAKILGFLALSLFLALFTLFPINDQPTSPMQVVVWIVLEVVLFAWLFDFFSIKIVT